MKRTIKVKLNLSKDDSNELLSLLETSSEIFNKYVDWSFINKTWSKSNAHKNLYETLRISYPTMPSAMIQSIRDCALESIKSLKFKFRPIKKSYSAIRYDLRTLTLRGQQLTLSSKKGRIRTIISFPKFCQDIVSTWKLKGGQLSYDKNKCQFYIYLNYDSLIDTDLRNNGEIVGLDRGLINIVATSRGEITNAKKIRKNQRKYLFLRKILSVKGTRSAKRLLKKLSGKEKRFNKEQNHIISKRLANDSSVKTYVIEDLKKIRSKRRGRKINKLLSSWTFFQLEQFLTYKCLASGINVVKVDARYTSQKCSVCGVIRKENRKAGFYECNQCGHKEHADINAAKNIRDRWIINSSRRLNVEQAAVNQPVIKSHDFVKVTA